MSGYKYDRAVPEQRKDAVKDWQEGQGGNRWQQEKAPVYDRGATRTTLSRGMTPVYDRGADVSRPDKGARNPLHDRGADVPRPDSGARNAVVDQQRQKQIQRERERAQAQAYTAEANRIYEEYLNSPEYAEKKNKATEHTSLRISPQVRQMGANKEADEYKNVVAYYKNQEEALEDRYLMEDDLEEYASWDEDAKKIVEDFLSGEALAILLKENPGVAQKYGEQRIREMAESLWRSRNQKAAEMLIRDGQAMANDGFWGSAIGTGEAIGNSLLSTVSAPLTWMEEGRISTGRYHTLDPNAGGRIYSRYSNAIINQVAENIESGNGFLGDLGAWAYRGGVGAADNLLKIALTGGSSVGTLGLMAVGSFDNTLAEASARGASPGEAVLTATASAGIEVLTEKIGLDELFKAGKTGVKSAKQFITSALKQGGVEATEEEIAFLGNLVVEAVTLQEKSSYNQQIAELVANGMSYDDAKNQVNLGLWEEALDTAVTSMFSGSAMYGGTALMTGGQYAAGQKSTDNATASKMEAVADKTSATGEDFTEVPGEKGPEAAPETQEADPAADFYRVAAEMIPREQTMQEPKEYSDAVIRAGLDEMTEADLAPVKNVQVPIQKDMPESVRYDALKDRTIAVVTDTESANHPQEMGSLAALKAKAKGQAEKIIKPLAKKLGILNRSMNTPDLEVEFQFSGGGLNESLARQLRYGGSYADFGRVMVNLDKVLANAVLVEQHGDKYKGTIRGNRNLESVSVLFGAFRDGDSVIPVQMEIKKTSDTGSHLYMTVTMTKIEADVKGKTVDPGQAPSLLSASEYNIADIFREINPQDAHFLKYIPDSFLTEEQIAAKQRALAEDEEKIRRYRETGRRGPVEPEGAGDGFEAMGAASRGFTGKDGYYDALYEGNLQRQRKGDPREAEVPVKDTQGRTVSEFVGNSMNSALTPETFTDTIQTLISEGKLSHDVQTNEETLAKAAAQIAADGSVYRSVQSVKEIAQSGKVSAEDIGKARLLYEHLTQEIDRQIKNNGEADATTQGLAADVYVSLEQMATSSGRSMQLYNLFRRMTPEYQTRVLVDEVTREVQRLQKRGKVRKDYEIHVDDQMLQEYTKAAEEYQKAASPEAKKEAEQKMAEAQNAIYLAEAAKLPASKKAKWDAWRYMAMLGNPKTQVRNTAGNLLFKPYVEVKDAIAAAMELAFIHNKSRRTKSFLGFSKADRALLAWAKADAKTDAVNNVLKGSARLGDDVGKSRLADNMKIFDSKILETARNAVSGVTEFGDMIFKNPYYSSALARYIKAQGYTAADIAAGRVNEVVLDNARAYAVNEAMKATFNDLNALSDFMANTLRYNGDNLIGKAVNTLGEGAMPFRKTPANIVARTFEYSPIGLVKGVWNAAAKVKSGKISAATAIDQIASGVTGTVAMGFGWVLANGLLGVRLRGSEVSEEEKEEGHQTYSLEFSVGGKTISYKIDWCAPANLPLFIGANLRDMYANSTDDTNLTKFTKFVYAVGTGFEPILNLSCMSSVNEILQSGAYAAADGEPIYAALSTALTSYFTQGVPSLLRQAEQVVQKNERETYANSEDPLIRDFQKTAARLPILGEAMGLKVDKIDDEGQSVSRGNLLGRIVNAFINPGTVKVIEEDEVDEEQNRLTEVLGEAANPHNVPKTITYTDAQGTKRGNYRLTAQEYERYGRVQGQAQQRILSEMAASDNYAALTDKQKNEAQSLVYDYARELARGEVLPGYDGKPTWMEGIEGQETDAIIAKVAGADLGDAMTALTTGWREGYADDSGAAESLEEAYQVYKSLSEPMRETVSEGLSERVRGYIEARDGGQEPESYMGAAKAVTLAEHHMEELRDAWKEGEDGSAVFAGLDQTYEAYRKLDEGQRKQVQEEVSSKTRYFLTAREAGVNTETFTRLYQQFDQINSGSEATGVDKAEEWSYTLQKAVEAGEITQRQAVKLRTEMAIFQIIPAEAKKYNEMTAAGISADDSQDLLWLLDGLEVQEGYSDVRDVQKWEAIAETSFLNDREKDAVMKIYMPDYDPTDRQPNKTELKYDYARQVFGLTPELYVAAYQAHAENSTKAGKIEAWRELGFSSKEAYLLYRLFASSAKDKIDVVAWYNAQ